MHICDARTTDRGASIVSFLRARSVIGGTLACPLLIVWWDYLRFCRTYGFDPAPAFDFVPWLLSLDGVRMIEGGRGRFKRCIVGLGLRPIGKDAP